MRLAILVPYYRLMSTKTHRCLMSLQQALCNRRIDFEFFAVDLTYIHKARKELMLDFLRVHKKAEFDWVVHIDSDQVFKSHQVFKLIVDAEDNGFDILSGIYFTKEEHKIIPVLLNRQENGKYRYLLDFPKKQFFEVGAFGFGFMVCRPKVYVDLFEKFGENVFDKEGEDIGWCEKVQELGYKTLVDLNVMIGHWGGEVGYRDYVAFMAQKAKGLVE